MNRYPMITPNKERGIKMLLDWCIKKYQTTGSSISKMMWYGRKEFLAELQRKQFYTKYDKEQYNQIRELYFNEDRNEKKN